LLSSSCNQFKGSTLFKWFSNSLIVSELPVAAYKGSAFSSENRKSAPTFFPAALARPRYYLILPPKILRCNDYQVDVFDFDGGCVTYYVEADSYEEAAANAEALAYGDGITEISHMNTYRV